MNQSKSTATCYACSVQLIPTNESKEHIIPNAIGGKLKSKRLLCINCNTTFGSKYESAFVDELRFFSGRLPIKRDRGENKKLHTVDQNTGHKIIIDEQGKTSLAHNIMLEKPDPVNGGRFRFLAPNEKEAKKQIESILRKYPNAKIDMTPQVAKQNDNDHILIGSGLGSLSFFKTAQKCLLNLYMHNGGSRSHIEKEANELFFTEADPHIWFYYDQHLSDKNANLSHTIVVYGRPEESLLFGSIEFFGGIRLIGVLNDNYDGTTFFATHSINPIHNSTRKSDIKIEINREQILSIISQKIFDETKLSHQLGLIESAVRSNHYFSNLIDGVFQKTLLRPENKEEGFTLEMIDEFINETVKAVMPNILAAGEIRRKNAEIEFQKQIAKRSKNKDES